MNDDPLSPVRDAYRDAVLAKDVDAFVALYDPQVRIFDLWGEWSCDGTEAWRALVAGWFGSLGTGRVIVDFDDVRTIVDGDLAVIHAFIGYRHVDEDGASERSMTNRLTWILQRGGGAWKIAHEHTSAPVDFDSMKAKLSR